MPEMKWLRCEMDGDGLRKMKLLTRRWTDSRDGAGDFSPSLLVHITEFVGPVGFVVLLQWDTTVNVSF